MTDELESLVIGMPVDFFEAHEHGRRNVLLQVWNMSDTPENREWVDSGWQDYYLESDPSRIFKIYHVSVLQVRESCTVGQITKWKEMLEYNPQVKVRRTMDFAGLMASYGLKLVQSEAEF